MFGWIKKRRRKAITASPWPEEWSLHLNRNVRLSWGMSGEELLQLQQRIKIFVVEKHWEGYDNLTVTDEMRVTIAALACMMLLGVEGFYFDNVKSILVFPHSFSRESSDGLITGHFHRAGEAWQGGPVLLSWKDTLKGGRDPDDGQNLVVHEFAHALDGLDGEMGGLIVFDDETLAQRWKEIVDREYNQLCDDVQRNISTLLDPYGASNTAEFFAVACEAFFEQPRQLRAEHAELYQLLRHYFRVDPISWQTPKRNRKKR